MKYLLSLLLISVTLLSCSKEVTDDGFKVYKINKGDHESTNRVDITVRDRVSYKVMFTESCLYKITGDDSLDVNKLFGLSDASSHSNHSARFGWRTNNGQIEIMTYVRRSGKIITEPIGKVDIGQVADYKIEILDTIYTFKFNSTVLSVKRESNYNGIRYHLWPYFGGNQTAPHLIEIHMKRLN
jgi:hypothetical protein